MQKHNYHIPLAYNTFGEEEYETIIAVMRSGRLTQGREVEKFEAAFAAYHGSKYAIMVNSGSSATLVAIESICYCAQLQPNITFGPLRRGDEVIIGGLCWPTTVKPLLNHGLQPVFCDIDLATLNITPQTVEAARTAATRAVVATPVMGNPEGLDELRAYCARNRLILFEDACESLGAHSASGRRVGTFGLAAAFSFYFSHHISTIEGGAILTDVPEIADLCYALRSHGWTRHLKLGAIIVDEEQTNNIDPSFCFFLPGYNVRATELTAALGSVQLGKLPNIVARRRRIVADRIQVLQRASNEVTVPGGDILERHSWMTLPLLFSSAEHKKKAQAILEALGIETRPIIVGNILRHPLVKFFGLKSNQPVLPGCDEVFARGLMVGLNPYSDAASEETIHAALLRVASEA